MIEFRSYIKIFFPSLDITYIFAAVHTFRSKPRRKLRTNFYDCSTNTPFHSWIYFLTERRFVRIEYSSLLCISRDTRHSTHLDSVSTPTRALHEYHSECPVKVRPHRGVNFDEEKKGSASDGPPYDWAKLSRKRENWLLGQDCISYLV